MALSRRTRRLVDEAMIARMKSDAWLVNTSRGPIVNEGALIEALGAQRIGGYAVDVFAEEPLPLAHPFRTLPNVLATPHIGYVAEDLYRTFYGDSARAISGWLARPDGHGKMIPLSNARREQPLRHHAERGDRLR